MIFDKLENIETYVSISDGLAKGLRLLKETDFSAMEPGKYTVDGDELYYMVQCYQSRPVNDTPEAHRKYIDIQYIVSGDPVAAETASSSSASSAASSLTSGTLAEGHVLASELEARYRTAGESAVTALRSDEFKGPFIIFK